MARFFPMWFEASSETKSFECGRNTDAFLSVGQMELSPDGEVAEA